LPTAPAPDGKPIGPRSRKGTETRARLLDAAKQVFEEDGFLEARISDIAERANLSHGSFYHYFESKEEVFREVAEAQQEALSGHAVVDSGLIDASPGTSVWDRLRASNRRYLEDYRDEARIMGVIEQVSRYDPEVQAVRTARQEHYLGKAEESIRRLQRVGRADPDLDPRIAAQALTAMVGRFAELWLVQGGLDCSFDDGIDALTTLCVNALRLEDDPRPRG
jgi:AcrR family transcriptional regulator